jgi:hypothetical protein
MDSHQIDPKNVSRPIQLLAAWLVGLIVINGSFLSAASVVKEPGWAPAVLVIAAVANVPIFLFCLFLLQTKFRPEMQEDQYYSRYLSLRYSPGTDLEPKPKNVEKQANQAAEIILQELVENATDAKRQRIREIITESEVEQLANTIGRRRALAVLFLHPQEWPSVVANWRDDPGFKEDIAVLHSEGAITRPRDLTKVKLTELGKRVAKSAETKNELWHQTQPQLGSKKV